MARSNAPRKVSVNGLMTGLGLAGLAVFLLGLGETDPEDVPSTVARLDDERSPMPELLLAYENVGIDDGTLAGLGALGDLATIVEPDPGYIETTDDVQAPLKLRRISVLRAGSNSGVVAGSSGLVAYTQNTTRRAKRANRGIPVLVDRVVARLGTVIKQAAALHNVPAQLIACKISIENPDLNATIVTGGGATGIMQISPGTADTALRDEYKAGNLLPAEIAYFKAKLGGAAWSAVIAGRSGHSQALLKNPAYNVHIGTLCFGQYLRKYTNTATGEVQVYKAAAEYNRGPRAEYANKRCSTPDELITFTGPGKTSTPPTTEQYIMLYCGPGGPMDYLTSTGKLA
jgi:hypothetical protein